MKATTLKATTFLQSRADGSENPSSVSLLSRKSSVSVRGITPMAALSTASKTVGLSQTFTRLKEQGKVAFIPYITAGDPDLSTTAEALKVLDSCGSDIIELGVPYSDPLADGPVIQAAATRSLTKGTNLDAIISMLKGVTFCMLNRYSINTQGHWMSALLLVRGTILLPVFCLNREEFHICLTVVPQLSCPIALFTYYNPILKRGTGKFMQTIREVGVHGLVVPDFPLEETEVLRHEALKNGIELVLLTTPTTPKDRMKAIVEVSEGFVYLVSAVGVTGERASVSEKVQSLLKEIKTATTKPVAVGFGISKPEHVKQVVGWGVDGVIVGSAMVKILGEAASPESGLEELETFTRSLTSAL